ncbi:MAG: alginate export family protein [Pseudomonadota bacterium]
MAKTTNLSLWIGALLLGAGVNGFAEDVTFGEAVTGGKAYLNFNLRYEGVDEDNVLEDAAATTLLTRFGYRTGVWNGFSAHVEFEDSRIVLGGDEFSVPPTGFNTGQYSVVADPETTELDQAYVQYASPTQAYKIRVGRQIISYDSQRFVGAVPWRQDWQTFDGVHGEFKGVDNLTVKLGHIYKRNRIFADMRDINSSDNLLDVSYQLPFGSLGGYAYLLENDDLPSNALDTVGIRFKGSTDLDSVKLLYKLEFATQDAESTAGNFDADYLGAEFGVGFEPVTVKVGVEVLGSDGGNYGFSTPLATLHKFNGWADLFLATPTAGLEDRYLSFSGKVEKFKYTVIYHDFASDSSATGVDDFGDEINFLLTRPIGDRYSFGLKYAAYSAGDAAGGKVDTDRVWTWFSAKFQ